MKKKKLIFITLSIILTALVIWTVWGNVTVGVTRYTVSNGKIPPAFDGYKIAVISDLHNAEFGKDNNTLISLIEQEKPDIIAFTGDLIDSNRTDIEISASLVKRLAETAPCYYVTGNHEARIGKRYLELEEKLLAAGAVVLHDGVERLSKNDETIQIAGLDDPDFTDKNSAIQESMLGSKLENMDLSDNFCILLSHRPEAFNAYVSENVDLVLSGHAHGGQFRLPFIGGLIAPNQGFFPKYDAGEFTENNTTMILSRGIGNSIIPVRFNNRPEIVIVELKCN